VTIDAPGPFTTADLEVLTDVALTAWRAGIDADWSVAAGTLDWSCFKTADHTIDCVFSYAQFLASRVTDAYPPFSEFLPPEAECARLRDHSDRWPFGPILEPTDDAWSDLLERSGRSRLTPRP
jgi:hypothetical protein